MNYENHCWSCHAPISSKTEMQCRFCNWFICSNCGSCAPSCEYGEGGYNSNGYDKEGYDRSGFNSEGYDKEGFDKSGYNKNGYNRFGLSKKDDEAIRSIQYCGTKIYYKYFNLEGTIKSCSYTSAGAIATVEMSNGRIFCDMNITKCLSDGIIVLKNQGDK